MKFEEKIEKAIFLRRPNRFQAYIVLDHEEIMVHVPNTGRCKEILIPGAKVLLRKGKEGRKTPYSLIAAYKDKKLINIDSQAPNKIVEEALKNKKILELVEYNNITREKTFGNSRFDFKLLNDLGEEYYLEVKGVTLECNRSAKFPDAPTERGTKHLLELIEVKKQGKGAGVMFLHQMDDIDTFTPNYEMDNKFGEALKLAYNSGVDIFAYQCCLDEEGITLTNAIKIIL